MESVTSTAVLVTCAAETLARNGIRLFCENFHYLVGCATHSAESNGIYLSLSLSLFQLPFGNNEDIIACLNEPFEDDDSLDRAWGFLSLFLMEQIRDHLEDRNCPSVLLKYLFSSSYMQCHDLRFGDDRYVNYYEMIHYA